MISLIPVRVEPFRVHTSGYSISGSALEAQGFDPGTAFRLQRFEYWGSGRGFRVQGAWYRGSGTGFQVQRSGYRILGK